MPTLIEKPSDLSSTAHLPAQLLQARHRWAQWRGVLIALLIGLAVTLAVSILLHGIEPGRWKILSAAWALGLILTALSVAVAWRFAPVSLSDTAQVMDRTLSTRNRLEAAANLHDSASPLARAQREETATYLKLEPRARPVRALPWLAGAVMALLIVHLLIFALWLAPFLFQPAAPPKPGAPPPPKELPRASIVWKSPEPETKANPIEEVPTVAVADSSTGLHDLTLEVSINGELKKTTPIPAQPFDQPGHHTIKVSIYLDELNAQPFDIISYFIRGQRITDQKVPDTTSAIQFIQVRSFRDDVREVPPGSAQKDYDLLVRLKLAQLRAVKENFILAHTDLAVTDPVRVKENDRVGHNQGDLSPKTEEVVQSFIEHGMSAEMVDLLRQAEAPMTDASKKILADQNVAALPPQEKALSLIIAVEKYFVKTMGMPKGGVSSSNPPDPFKDKQKHEMKKRFETAAGQLEQLAQNQAKLAQDIDHGTPDDAGTSPPSKASATPDKAAPAPGSPGATPPSPAENPGASAPADSGGKPVPLPTPQSVDPFGPDSGKGTFAERQARVLQGIEALLNTNNVLPPPVLSALQDAQKHAADSVHQLDQADAADAREPAAAAAQDLQQALAEMNKAGDEQTRQAMEEAQQKLNDIARQLNDLAKNGTPGTQQAALSGLAAQVQAVQKQLSDAADQQQEGGSAAGAKWLNHLANQIGQQGVAKDLGEMGQTGLDPKKALAVAQTLETLAGQAAQGMAAGKPSAQDLAHLVNAMETSRANLAHLAQSATGSTPTAPTPSPAAPGGPQPGSPSPGNSPGAQGQNPGNSTSPKPDSPSAQAQGAGQGQGQGEGGHPDQPPNGPPKPSGPSTTPGSTPGPNGSGSGGETASAGDGPVSQNPNESTQAKAYQETIADLKNEAQQAAAIAPGIDAEVTSALHTYQVVPLQANVVQAYQAIAPPLDKLIANLQVLAAHAQREDIVRQPDLDEAPPSYRPAVSDYFENMSRDYHPDDGVPTPKP